MHCQMHSRLLYWYIQFIFEVEVLKMLCYFRTNKNAFFYLGLTFVWKFLH